MTKLNALLQVDETSMRALPISTRRPVPGPVLRPRLRPLVPQLGLLGSPHPPHPALRGRKQPSRLADRRLAVQSQGHILLLR